LEWALRNDLLLVGETSDTSDWSGNDKTMLQHRTMIIIDRMTFALVSFARRPKAAASRFTLIYFSSSSSSSFVLSYRMASPMLVTIVNSFSCLINAERLDGRRAEFSVDNRLVE
jgi:hypothetical protein